MIFSKNEHQLLIQNEEQILTPKNKNFSFHNSDRKRILLFCFLFFVVVMLCFIGFYYFQFDIFWNKKQVLNNDSQHIFKNEKIFDHKDDEIFKLIGEYEYCDRINGPYIKSLNGGVCVKIDCYILNFKNWNNCIQCICLKVSRFDLENYFPKLK